MLGGGVAPGLGGELLLLQSHEGGHAGLPVAGGQIEDAVVEGMETGQGDELVAVAQGAQILLEARHRIVIQMGLPVEGRRTVVGQELTRVAGVDGGGELPCLVQIRRAGLEPDEIAVGCVGQSPGDGLLHAAAHPIETFDGTLTGEEAMILGVHVAGEQSPAEGIRACHEHRGYTAHVRRQARRGQLLYRFPGGQQDLAAHVATLFRR